MAISRQLTFSPTLGRRLDTDRIVHSGSNSLFIASTKCRISSIGTRFRRKLPRMTNRKSYATLDTYAGYLKKWILPRWESYRLPDVKSVQAEQWLKSLTLAPGSKAKIRNIASALYGHAIRWEWAPSQSHHSRAAECQAQRGACCIDNRADQGLALTSRRALSDCCTARCCDWPEGRAFVQRRKPPMNALALPP